MNYTEFKAAVFAQAQTMELTDYELYYSAGDSVSLDIYQGEINGFSSTTGRGVCFRCLLNGQMGYASTSLLSQEEAIRLVEHAIDNANTMESEEEAFIHPGDDHYEQVEQRPVTEPTTEEMIDFAQKTYQAMRSGDARVSDASQTQVAYEYEELAIDNSYGLSLHEEQKLAVAYADVILEDGETYNAYQIEIGSLDSMDADTIAKKAIEKAASQVGAQTVPTGAYRVVLTPNAMHSLMSVFTPVFSAENAQKGLSLLSGKEGEEIAAACVTLMDDPFYADSYVKASFDAEGCATHTKAVVENGVLKTLLHNLKTAHTVGIRTTANASKKGYAAPVDISPYTFYIVPGDKTQDELMAEVGEGFLITSVTGLHAGANAVSGDFSLQSNGFYIKDGKKGSAVRNFTTAGNFFTMLKEIEMIGSDLELSTPSGNTCYGSPSVVVKSLSLAGK